MYVTRDRQWPAPVISHFHLAEHGEQRTQTFGESLTNLFIGIKLTRDLGPEVIPSTPTTKSKTAICGALPIDDVLTKISKGGSLI